MSKNGEKLRQLIEAVNLGPEEALVIWNKGQAIPLPMGIWLSYMIDPTKQGWKPCPDSVILHMQLALRAAAKSSTTKDGNTS